jgi:hypothetical protein
MFARNPQVTIPNEVVGMAAMVGLVFADQPDLALLVAAMVLSRHRCQCILHCPLLVAETPDGPDR